MTTLDALETTLEALDNYIVLKVSPVHANPDAVLHAAVKFLCGEIDELKARPLPQDGPGQSEAIEARCKGAVADRDEARALVRKTLAGAVSADELRDAIERWDIADAEETGFRKPYYFRTTLSDQLLRAKEHEAAVIGAVAPEIQYADGREQGVSVLAEPVETCAACGYGRDLHANMRHIFESLKTEVAAVGRACGVDLDDDTNG